MVGTHGRSIWILDDLTPVRDWSSRIADEPAHLFPPRPAIRWEQRSGFHGEGPGENPPKGAVLNYSLKKKVEGEITMEILDAKGAVVRSFTGKKEPPEIEEDDPDAPEEPKEKPVLSTDAGVQRIAWDLAYQSAAKIKGAKFEGNPEAAPRALPGAYTVRLTVEGKSVTTPLEVRLDPRLAVGAADLEAQLALARTIQDQITRLSGMVAQIRSVREQLRLRIDALEGNARAADWVKQAKDLEAKCDALEEKLHNPKAQVGYDILAKGARVYSRLSPLMAYAADGSGAPTQGMREVFADQSRDLEAGAAEWAALQKDGLGALTRKGRELDLGDIVVPGAAPAR